MNNPRRFTTLGFLTLAFVVPSFATMWTGTITETVTYSEAGEYSVGDVFHGSYSYESDTMDGTFYASPVPGHADDNRSLGGSIFIPFVETATVDLTAWGGPSEYTYTGGFGPTVANLESNDRIAYLSVADGVASLVWVLDLRSVFIAGGDKFWADSFNEGYIVSGPSVQGAIEYGAPTQETEISTESEDVSVVPDTSSTATLLAAAVIAGYLFKRRLNAALEQVAASS